MKRVLTILLGAMLSLPLSAQVERAEVQLVDSVSAGEMPTEMLDEALDDGYTGITLWRPSYHGLPSYGYPSYAMPSVMPVYRPSFYGPHYMDLWDIHKGLNASVDMGVSVGVGKHNPWKGAHFFTDLTLLYAYPVNDRLTLAAGMDYGYFSGLGSGMNNLSLFGLANYKINDRFDVTGFVSHDFGQLGEVRPMSRPMMPFMGPSTTVGADLGIKVGENTKINIGVSFTREENPMGPPPPPVRHDAQQGRER
ncbi:MAG: hypothetical protein KBT39_06735 [Bacteroidales bacterium]|nr:hypothetical protein [Bacteroidales bacterium]